MCWVSRVLRWHQKSYRPDRRTREVFASRRGTSATFRSTSVHRRTTSAIHVEPISAILKPLSVGWMQIYMACRRSMTFDAFSRFSGVPAASGRWMSGTRRVGGRHGQHLAIAWDNSKLELVGQPIEIDELVLELGMRPAFAGYFRSLRAGGVDFTVVVVHLESGPQNFADRRRQNRELASWIKTRIEETGDPDVIVLGDFNTTGSPRGGLEGELQSVDAILGDVGLERLHNPLGCTSYWEGGGERDGVQRAVAPRPRLYRRVRTWRDLQSARGLAPLLAVAMLRTHFAVGEEDGTFWDVSDHCPMTFEIRDAVD